LLARVGGEFAAIASAVESRAERPDVPALFSSVEGLCREAAQREPSGERRQWLVNVQSVLQTWQQVWPRLGGQREFRLAVAREARLWSKRFAPDARA
jgi:hypothetical protein